MVSGVCVECGGLVGSAKRACPHCGCAEPMPTKARYRCDACHQGVMALHQPCPHCGAPDPTHRGSAEPALLRCAACGNPTHVAATQCRKCRAPSGGFVPAVTQQAPPLASEAAQRGRAVLPAQPRMASDGAGPVRLGARPDSHSFRLDSQSFRLDSQGFRPAGQSLRPASQSLRPATQGHRPVSGPEPITAGGCEPAPQVAAEPRAAFADDQRHSMDVAQTDVRPADRIPCGRCGEIQAPGLAVCPACGVEDPARAEPIAPQVPVRLLRIPRLPLAAALLGAAALAGFTVYTRQVQDEGRRARIWQALGAGASEAAVQAVEAEADAVGVSTDALLWVRFYCLHREEKRPSRDALHQIARQAAARGADPGAAVTAAARSQCRR